MSDSHPAATQPAPRRSNSVAYAIALVILLGAAAGLSFAVAELKLYLRKLPIEVDRKVSSVPTETTTWKQVGADEVMSTEMVEELGTKNYVSRRFIRKDAAAGKSDDAMVLDLHLAYYTGMVDTVPHIPDRCLVGGGWSIAGETRVVPMNLDQDASVWTRENVPEESGVIYSARLGPMSSQPGLRVRLPRDADQIAFRFNPYTHPKESRKLYAGYFFIANGGHCHRAEDVRLLAFRLTDSYAYYLKVQVSTHTADNEDEFVQAASSLVGELLPDIMRCVPDWVDVLRGDYPPDNPARGQRESATSRN